MKKILLLALIIFTPRTSNMSPINPLKAIGISLFSYLSLETFRCHDKIKQKNKTNRKIDRLSRITYHSTKIQNDLMIEQGKKLQLEYDLQCKPCNIMQLTESKIKDISQRYT
jgi:hypothetical protein